MENLIKSYDDKANQNFFRAVRDDLSLRKRSVSYLVVGAIAGVGGGLAMLIPAIGPLIAAPTFSTLLSVSTTLVGGAVITGVPLAAQHAVLRKDNRLYKAERGLQTAAKIQIKLKENEYSDREYARLIRKRDKKIARFERARDTYERKTRRLANKVHGVYDDDLKELNEIDGYTPGIMGRFTEQGSMLYNRRMKKFDKVRPVYARLNEDWADYKKISTNDAETIADFKQNLDDRSVSQRTVRGARKVADVTKSGAHRAAETTRKGAGYVGNSAKHLGTGTKNSLKSVYGAAKGVISKYFSKAYETNWDLESAWGMPHRAEKNIINQFKMEAENSIYDCNRNGALRRYNEKKQTFEVVQPNNVGVVRGRLFKDRYFDHLQNESVHEQPFPVNKDATVEDYQLYYENKDDELSEEMTSLSPEGKTSKLSEKMTSFADLYHEVEDQFQNVEENILKKNDIGFKMGNGQMVVQFDLDKPNFTVSQEFDDIQKALAYTRALNNLGSKAFKNKDCDGFRITTWVKEMDGTYMPKMNLCTLVANDQELEISQTNMRDAFVQEMYLLHLNQFIKTSKLTNDSTIEIIRSMEKELGGKITREDVIDIVNAIPEGTLNQTMGCVDGKNVNDIKRAFNIKQQFKGAPVEC